MSIDRTIPPATAASAWRKSKLLSGLLLIAAGLAGSAAAPVPLAAQNSPGLEAACTPEGMQAIASAVTSSRIVIGPVKFGPLPTGARYTAASGTRPAFCQVSGSFVTNPATGKTAGFMATFPENWNGKFMQLGCSGHCGQFFVSDPATPSITVTAQGYAGQIIEKGYATFATNEGHEGMDSAKWAVKADGSVDQDYVDDWLYRADKVLSVMGKEFTTTFYARMQGGAPAITRSYFNGCSGGGRDAMVAASYFPEAFDGIIAGSPYDPLGMSFQASAIGAAAKRSPDAGLSPALLALFDKTVKAQCDGLDGVKDGVIQNPAACNFRPERDLPRCSGGAAGGQCFTPAQIETASVIVSGVTDERGTVVQPGYSVSELAVMSAAMAFLTDPSLKVFVHGNDPAFVPSSIFSFRRGGPGPVTAFHAVVPAAEVARAKQALRLGAGHLPENTGKLIGSKAKLLMWHNSSDEMLTPFSSVNWYKRLAAMHGGYARVHSQARLFMLPGTSHCSIGGIAPNSFDSISALEHWVEMGHAPDALMASVADRQFSPGLPKAAVLQYPNWTMPLCKFPAMARYSGKGDIKDGANWSCPANDKRLLTVGESGRQGGVIR